MKLGLLVIALAACGGMKRSQTVYRADTQQLLASRTSQLESCYAKTLAANGQASGLVTVNFTVEKKTGKLKEAKADQAHTTAPEPVVLCVLESLAGLTLQPPDGNDGKATFAYDLHPAS